MLHKIARALVTHHSGKLTYRCYARASCGAVRYRRRFRFVFFFFAVTCIERGMF